MDWVSWYFSLFRATPMFLGPPLSMAIVYVWARRNPNMRMNLLGFLNFNAPYLPWVIVAIESLIGQNIEWFDLVGIALGHLYYFLEDVYPRLTNRRLLRTPPLLFVSCSAISSSSSHPLVQQDVARSRRACRSAPPTSRPR